MSFLRRANIFQLCAALALSLFVSVPAHAKETAAQTTARRTLTALYAKGDQDGARKDIEGLMAPLAPDFKIFLYNGPTLDRAQYQTLTAASFKDITNVRCATKIEKIEWRGTDAVVYASNVSQWTQKGLAVQTTGTTREFWSPSSDKWQLRQVVELSKHVFVNGKEVVRG